MADAGLVYVGARWYSPRLRRFISPDPVGVPDAAVTGVNRFHYGLDNPLAYTDPDGEFVNLIVGALAGAAIDAAMQGVLIATGVQDEFNWGQVAGAAAMGVVGGGVFSKGVQLVKALKRGKIVAKKADFEIVDGVRRSKAAELNGNKTINAQIVDANDKVLGRADIPLDSLKSPKTNIDLSSSQTNMDRWMNTFKQTQSGSKAPDITVTPGTQGTRLKDVGFD